MNMNELSAYAESGRKAGIAANEQDWSRVRFEQDWLRRAQALETEAYAREANLAWRTAYSSARRIG